MKPLDVWLLDAQRAHPYTTNSTGCCQANNKAATSHWQLGSALTNVEHMQRA